MDRDDARSALAVVLYITAAGMAAYGVSDYYGSWLHHHPLIAWPVALYCFARMLIAKR